MLSNLNLLNNPSHQLTDPATMYEQELIRWLKFFEDSTLAANPPSSFSAVAVEVQENGQAEFNATIGDLSPFR